MSDLTEFVLARIAEREPVARDMQDQARLGRPFFDPDRLAGGTGIRELVDPARVLAQCAALREIVALYQDEEPAINGWAAHQLHEALRALASIWARHPDYREEWRR